ncbi:helix-turn-helix domain-containing protein [Patescibacteria group bacterium]|nr:helix-turn-helix domain-containing protein [Patescibacteria group bacterium]
MDELEISGKRYISAKRIAKENKYHPDYVGQLIRAGRVSGTKVGRAWYVDEASFAEYLGKERGQSLATPAQNTNSPEKTEPTQEPSFEKVLGGPRFPSETLRQTFSQEVPVSASAPVVVAQVESTVTPAVEAAKEISLAGMQGGTTVPYVGEFLAENSPRSGKLVSEAAFVAEGFAKPVIAEKKVPFKTSLTYIPDNSPLFPAIQKRTKPAAEVRKDEYVVAQIAKPAHTAQPILRPKRSIWKTGFAVASVTVVAAIFFGFAFFGSLGINSVVIVEKGKPASVAFAQEKTFCFIFKNCQNSKN